MIAYLDANAVEDIESLRGGVDDSMVGALREALRDGRLSVPFSGDEPPPVWWTP